MPRSKTWWYTRITLLVLGLIVVYLGVPIVYSLLDVEMDGTGGWIQIGLMLLLIVGFVAYLALSNRGVVDRE